MLIFSSVYIKSTLICFVSDSIFYPWSKHHLLAFHIISHTIFKIQFKSFLIYKEEIDFSFFYYLNSHIAFDIIYKTSDRDCVVMHPWFHTGILIFFHFETQYVTWALNNKSFIINEIHLSKIHFSHSFKFEITCIICLNGKSLALSVERVDFLFIIVIKALNREIFSCAIYFKFRKITHHWFCLHII